MANKKKFYGWIIAAAAFLVMFAAGGLVNMTFSLYTIPITKALDVPRYVFIMCASIRALTICVISLIYGSLLDRFGLRKLLASGALFVVVSLLTFAAGRNVWIFYAGGILQGIGFSFTMTLPLSILISNWFIKRRGTVLGIVYAASGAGGVIFSPIVGVMIEKVGWQASFLITAVISVVVFLPSLFVIKERPSDIGQTALGGEPENRFEKHESAQLSGITLGGAVKTPSFWMILAVVSFSGLAINAAYLNVAPHFTDVGFSPMFVSGVILVIICLSNTIGKIGMGAVNDRFGVGTVNTVGGIASIIALIMFLFSGSDSPVSAIVSVLFMGVASTLLTVPIPLMVAKIFGSRDFAAINGVVLAVNTLAQAIGGPLSNYTFDVTGSYSFSFEYQIILVIGMIIASCLALKLRPVGSDVSEKSAENREAAAQSR